MRHFGVAGCIQGLETALQDFVQCAGKLLAEVRMGLRYIKLEVLTTLSAVSATVLTLRGRPGSSTARTTFSGSGGLEVLALLVEERRSLTLVARS